MVKLAAAILSTVHHHHHHYHYHQFVQNMLANLLAAFAFLRRKEEIATKWVTKQNILILCLALAVFDHNVYKYRK
jgi:formate/nitrite transporter FocA (FNT family)